MTDVDEFWSWFVANEHALRSGIDAAQTDLSTDPPIFTQLDARVRSLGEGLRWEVGPGLAEPMWLVISAGGIRKNLPFADAVVTRAPKVVGWEFHAGRPVKPGWSRRVELAGHDGQVVNVDASAWRYGLVMFGGGTFFDITLFVGSSLDGLDDRTRLTAAYIVLDGELGERMVIERIGDVQVQTSSPPGRSGAIENLRQHVTTLAK